MIPKPTAFMATASSAVSRSAGTGLAVLLVAHVAALLAASPDSVRAEPAAPVQTKSTPAVAQTLPRVTVVSERPTRAPANRPTAHAQQTEKVCGTHEDTLRVLKMTAIESGVRVDYQFAVSGASTWTNMNRPLLRQFGVRPGRTFCLPHDRNSDMQSADASDAE